LSTLYKPGGIIYVKPGDPEPMPNDLNLSIKPGALEFTTLEVRILEHLVSTAIDERIDRRRKMLAKPSTRRREADAEFEMSLEPLHHMLDKIGRWIGQRRAT
jgi:hypothetical protein